MPCRLPAPPGGAGLCDSALLAPALLAPGEGPRYRQTSVGSVQPTVRRKWSWREGSVTAEEVSSRTELCALGRPRLLWSCFVQTYACALCQTRCAALCQRLRCILLHPDHPQAAAEAAERAQFDSQEALIAALYKLQ